MTSKEYYEKIYKILGAYTPIMEDCGKLCGSACCEGEEDTGMYLFPGEKHLYNKEKGWLKIIKSDFEYSDGKFADILVCKSSCPRDKRPLSCRIFPLLPYVNEYGEVSVKLDPRGKSVCPIVKADLMEELNSEFVKRVLKIGKIMMHSCANAEFLFNLSRLTDEYDL
ncbi:MAG: hypothetical protein IJC89_02905 [Clostridia bacterium]|nr:hypothetical protein [Clostridia bacterium]